MLSYLSSFFGDGRTVPMLASVVALLALVGLAFWFYRLAFTNRLRPPGGARGRAPRLGVVDVFGLDGQRQLVIVRRDNVEHLLLMGGPNDILIEANIMRSADNGRDAGKLASPSETPVEVASPTAPAAPSPRAAPPARRDPAPRSATAEPGLGLADPRGRPAPAMRAAPELPGEAAKPDASKPDAAKPEVVKAEPARIAPARLEAAKPEPGPAVVAVPPRPATTFVGSDVSIIEPPSKAGADAECELAEAAKAEPRRAPPPRIAAAPGRPSLPPPIMPLRLRNPANPISAPVNPPSSEIVVAKPMPTPIPAPPKMAPPNVAPPTGPIVSVEVKSVEAKTVEMRSLGAPIAVRPPEVAVRAAEVAPSANKPKKEDTFYDLESLEAEMARLLGRDP